MSQERELRKNKSIANWEEEKLKKTMVKIIQQLQKAQAISERFLTSIKGWNTSMHDTTPSIEPQKPQEFIISQSKLILVKEVFQDINRQMFETNYNLNLGQLLKMVPKLE